MSNNLKDMTMDFAVNVLAVCDTIKGHYSIINQLERSATSIGAYARFRTKKACSMAEKTPQQK